jgi:hypothetical protein
MLIPVPLHGDGRAVPLQFFSIHHVQNTAVSENKLLENTAYGTAIRARRADTLKVRLGQLVADAVDAHLENFACFAPFGARAGVDPDC